MLSLDTVKSVFHKYEVTEEPPEEEEEKKQPFSRRSSQSSQGKVSTASQPTNGNNKKPASELEKSNKEEKVAYIPRCSIAQALWDLDINPVFTDLDRIVAAHDLNGDGKIDMEEFKSFYLTMYRDYATNPQRALTTFANLDVDCDSFLTKEELRRSTCGDYRVDKLTDEEFEEFWHYMRGNDAEICAAAFVVALCPSVQADELNPLLLAYGYPANAEMYCTAKKQEKPKPKRRLGRKAIQDKKRKQHEEEEARKKQEAEAELRRQQDAEKKEAERKREREREDERKKREEEERKAREEEERKKKEEKGGCCVVS